MPRKQTEWKRTSSRFWHHAGRVQGVLAVELILALSAVMGLVLLSAQPLLGQVGGNAVYSSTGLAASPAFIDASDLQIGDICNTINTILVGSNYPATGAVIDARGFMPSKTQFYGSQPCGSNPFSLVTKPSTVLLPASTILLSFTWVLPNNTRIIGEGPNSVLRACTSGTCTAALSGDMIDMGSSSICTPACSGISVEHLTLDGQSLSVNGIVNSYAQESSYVNDVAMTNIHLTGLSVVGPGTNVAGANGSGPYSNIIYGCSPTDGSLCKIPPSPVCVSIQATNAGAARNYLYGHLRSTTCPTSRCHTSECQQQLYRGRPYRGIR